MTLVGLAACAGVAPPDAPTAPDTASVKLPRLDEGLTISTTDLTSDGRFAKIRGRVTNPFKEEVDGIRYVVRIETRGDQPRPLDRFEYETSDRLAPGDGAMMRLDVESMYFGSASQLAIIALPKKLGGRVIPLPAEWK
jgi:hypothetical protein